MKTVYYIERSEFFKMSKQYANNLGNIMRDHFGVRGDSIENALTLSDKNAVVYWLENGTAKYTNNFTKSFNYKYVEVTLSSINTIFNENRLQKQKTDVVRGNDAEGNRIQSRVRKTTITVGHLSYKAIKG